MIKLYLISISFIFGLLTCSGQIIIKEGSYSTFDGRSVNVYLIEGEYCVLNIDTSFISKEQLSDTLTLSKILYRSDAIYLYYLENMGYEPSGGNPNYSFKTNVFFGGPSCGAACGLVGAKGIEIGGFQNLFYNLKYIPNVSKDVVIGYELGRNFFNFSNKILFPFNPNTNEKNGGFAEGFAGLMSIYSLEKILVENEEKELNEVCLNTKWALQKFHGYINDTTATPYNSFAKWEKHDLIFPNRGFDGLTYEVQPAYSGGAILFGIFETLDREKMFPKFFEILRTRPSVSTIEDALSNIAYSASFSLNKNLNPFFKNVLKFNINPDAEAVINSLPSLASTLIRDETLLWFLSPFDTLTLNLRSTNYLADGLEYRIILNDEIYSESVHGNNKIPYSIFGKREEVTVTCNLIDGESIVDSYDILIKKRHNINLFNYKEDFYAAYLSNVRNYCYFKDDTLILESLAKNEFTGGRVKYNFVFGHDRLYRVEANIRNTSAPYDPENGITLGYHSVSGFSNFGISGPGRAGGAGKRIGLDVARGDTINFIDSWSMDSSSLYMPEERTYFMNYIYVSNEGYGQKTEVTDFYFYDLTDTDGDGIVDFEDDCPSEFGTNNGCPNASIISENDLLKMNVFPNPNDGKFKVVLESNEVSDISFKLVNVNGQIIEQRMVNSIGRNIEQFDFSNLSKGIYHLIISSDKIQKSEKIVIQ